MVLQPDSKVVVAGYAAAQNGNNFLVARYNSDGSLDSAFGNGGQVVTPIGDSDGKAEAVALQPDGKLVVAGSISSQLGSDIAVVRYNPNGTLDATFGSGGVALVDISVEDLGASVTVQPDGKVLVAGSSGNGGDADFAVVRFRSNGTLDSSFGNGGKVLTVVGTYDDRAESVLLQSDGKIVVAGRSSFQTIYDFAVVRYNSNGLLDTTFSSDGKVSTHIAGDDHAYCAAIQADGKILVGGYTKSGSYADFALARYRTDGNLDTTFGSGGKVTTAVGTFDDRIEAIAVQADGKVVVAGRSSYLNVYDFAVVRYNASGSRDTSFRQNGMVSTHVLGNDNAFGVVVQSDGTVLVAGDTDNGRRTNLSLVRYQTNGQLFINFGGFYKTLSGTVNFTEGQNSVVLDSDVQLYDPDLTASNNFGGSTLKLQRSGGANSQDAFISTGTLSSLVKGGSLTVEGVSIGLVVSNENGLLDLAFNGNATNNLVNTAMQQIAYRNLSDSPPQLVQIAWDFSDGNTGSQGTGGALPASGSVNVEITAVNDAPTFSFLGGDVTYRENVVVARLCNSVRIQDVDTTVFTNGSLNVVIESGGEAADRLWLTPSSYLTLNGNQLLFAGLVVGTWSGGNNGSPLAIEFNSRASLNRVQHVLRCVCFAHDSDNPSSAQRTVAILLDDGAGGQATVSKKVNVVPVNDRPVLSGFPSGSSYNLNSSPILLAPGALVSDPDNSNFAGGQLGIRFVSGADSSNRLLLGAGFVLEASNNVVRNNVVIGQLNVQGGVGTTGFYLTFNSNASKTIVQELLRGISFQTINGTTKIERVIEFSLSDGSGGTSSPLQTRIEIL
jgi:uncharacterized delta-60 repeat protein